MRVHDRIAHIVRQTADPKERRRKIRQLKSEQHYHNLKAMPATFVWDQYVVLISNLKLTNAGDLSVVLEVKQDGVVVLPADEFVFVNPPILVLDPNGDITTGTQKDRTTLKEDLPAAILHIIKSTLARCLNQG